MTDAFRIGATQILKTNDPASPAYRPTATGDETTFIFYCSDPLR